MVRKRWGRPSPALIVSIIALVIACAGTAAAAGVFIKKSSQLGTGVVTSRSIQNGTISGTDIKSGSISASKLSGGSALTGGGAGLEVYNFDGPTVQSGVQSVATLDLPAGEWAVFATTVITRVVQNDSLLQINGTANASCALNVAGDEMQAGGPLSGNYSTTEADIHLQMTRTLAAGGGKAVLNCTAPVSWKAGGTSIIAIQLGSVTRTQVTG
jgi:hypothetical protein